MTKPPALLSIDNPPPSNANQTKLSWYKRVIPQWIHSSKARLMVSSAALFVASCALFAVSTYLPVTPNFLLSGHQIHKPLVIALNQHLGELPVTGMSISPKLEGSWQYQQGTILSGDQISFIPKTTFAINTTYTVTFPTASRLLGGEAKIEPISFKTETAPSIVKHGISTLSNQSTIPADYLFAVKLSAASRGLRELELRTEPEIQLVKETEDDTIFTWKSPDLLPQGQPITLELYDHKNKTSLLTKNVTVAAEPTVNELAKKELIGPDESILLTFSQPIAPEYSSHITVDVEGQGEWQDETTFHFTPKELEPGKTYTISIKAGIHSTSGGILTTDQSRTFSTIGPVSILASSPHGTGLKQTSQNISFTFDQPVDHASVESRFSISSGTITHTAWNENTFTATVTNLGYQRSVTATLAAGILNTGFGLPSSQQFTHNFTTEIRTARLNVPLYLQQHSGTCTAASLRMALSYKGITTDEMTLVQRMGYNPKNMDKSTDPPTWDDPQLMFVGSVDGKIREGTGAGPDAPPVAKAAKTFGVDAEAVTGINIHWVAQQIYSNRPVIFFGAFDNTPEYITWKTPAGKSIKMNVSSHARTIYGVQGEPTNPIGFWIHDPLYGSSYWSAGVLAHNISLDPDRQAVVVR